MADGDIDFNQHSVETLVGLIRRIDRKRYPLNHENAWRALREKWPEAPEDLTGVQDSSIARMRETAAPPPPVVPVVSESDGSLRFTVRFQPSGRPRRRAERTNNLDLPAEGAVEINATQVLFLSASGKFHAFERALIANVEYSASEPVVTVRNSYDDRYVTVWLQSREQAEQLVSLLPTQVTPHWEEQRRFIALAQTISPFQRVTPMLVGINVMVFAIMAFAGAGLFQSNAEVHVRFGSNLGPLTWNGEYWRLLTNVFLHFGLVHLAFNMYALWSGGRLIERLYGSARFLIIYLLSGVAGSVVSGWWELQRNSAGASGAIFGVYGALLVFFARRRKDIPVPMLMKNSHGVLALLGYSLISGASKEDVDNAAHVGGLLAGALAGFLLARPFDSDVRAKPQPGKLAWVAVTVCAALAALSMPLWSPTGAKASELRYSRLLRNFSTDEDRVVTAHKFIIAEHEAGRMTAAEVGKRLREEIIPDWMKSMAPILDTEPLYPPESTPARELSLLKQYIDARTRAMTMTAESVLDGVPYTEQDFQEQWGLVNRAVEQLEALRQQ